MSAQTTDPLDLITLQIDAVARKFDVSFRAAGLRAVSLGIITREQWDALVERAKQEAAARAA